MQNSRGTLPLDAEAVAVPDASAVVTSATVSDTSAAPDEREQQTKLFELQTLRANLHVAEVSCRVGMLTLQETSATRKLALMRDVHVHCVECRSSASVAPDKR